jgi:hypothetical protein
MDLSLHHQRSHDETLSSSRFDLVLSPDTVKKDVAIVRMITGSLNFIGIP